MAKIEDFQAVLATVNETTNNIAADIEALIAQIANGGMSVDEEAQVLSELQAVADRLKVVADINPDSSTTSTTTEEAV